MDGWSALGLVPGNSDSVHGDRVLVHVVSDLLARVEWPVLSIPDVNPETEDILLA